VSGATPEPQARGATPPGRAVWVDGRIVRGEEARISLFDRGARDGEGLFETLRVHAGRAFRWDRHMERLVLAAAELGFPVPPSSRTLDEAVASLLAAGALVDAVVRVTVTRGIPGGRPTRAGAWVEAEPVEGRLWRGTRSGEASAIVSGRPFAPGSLGGYKTTSRLAYHLAREEARAARADEALLADASGALLEGAVSNLFAWVDGELRTAPLTSGVLPGITRAYVLETCAALGLPVRERAVAHDERSRIRELFLTNAVQGVVPVASLDGVTLPERERGMRVREAYQAAVRDETRSGTPG
jgi:branched-chain amino acid aminotransferase